MINSLGFWAGLALLVLFVGGAVFALWQFRKVVREDERREYEQRQAEARSADQERAHDIAQKAEEAAAHSRDDAAPLSERLQRSGRSRTTKN